MSRVGGVASKDSGTRAGRVVFGPVRFAVASTKVLVESVGLRGRAPRGWVLAASFRAFEVVSPPAERAGASGLWRAGRAASGVLLRVQKPRGGLEVLGSAVLARARMSG
jgi:hypothetical protein